jgi:hypothetical protein
MFLFELFDADEMTDQLQQAALDYLTPLLSQNVPFVTVNQMIEALRNSQFGIVINRPVIMDLLDPDKVEAVAKIEGDRIYLKKPDEVDREVDDDEAEQDQEQVSLKAQDQAQKNITEPAPAPAPEPKKPAAPNKQLPPL